MNSLGLLRAAALAAGVALLAATAAAADYELHEKVLDNGLRVVTLEDHSCPVVAIQVWYHVGSKDEDPERTGFAHMFEHMMFRGTDRLGPEDHFEFIRGVGGDCNAYTAFDQTVYVQKVPSNQLPMVFWLEAERMSALKVDEEGFATERAVVEEERRLGLNQPYGSVPEKLLAQVFKEHPYRWSPIGQIEHLRAATSEELLRFWETFYVPNNATVVVVGDVDHAFVEEEAEKAFGWIPRCADPPRVAVREPLPGEPLEITIQEESGPVPIVAAAYRTVAMDHEDALALEMLMAVLGGGESSRVYKSVVDDAEKAAMAMAGAFNLEHEGVAAAGAVLMPFGDAGGALELIDREIARLKEEPVTESELVKVKNTFLRQLVDGSMTVESKAQLVGTAAVFQGGAETLNRRAERIESMSVEDLSRVAETYLTPERRITVRIEPTIGGMVKSLLGGIGKKKPDADEEKEGGKKEQPATSTMAERRGPKAEAVRPEGYPESAPVAPLLGAGVPLDVKEQQLDNGLRVVVIENHEVPIVSMRLGLLNGAFMDLPDKPGAASFACQMLTKGAGGRTAQEIAEELETNAVELGGSAGMDSAAVAGSAVSHQLGRLARLMATVVKSPAFPEKEFEKLRRQVLTGLAISEKQPASIAEREFRKGLFGEHFYAREATGTSKEVEALAVADLAEWWRRCARPDQAVLYFAGDVDPGDAFEVAEAFFGDWQVEGQPPAAAVQPIPEPAATRILLVDVPGAIQSQIRVGQLGFTRQDDRSHLGRILTQVFGGSFNSRLNKTIRVEKGLTYGARGGLSSDRFAGRFFVSTFSKTESTAEAVRAILDEIERMRTEPPSADEMAQARSFLVGSFAGNHETPGSIAGELWSLEVDGLDWSYLDRSLEIAVGAEADAVAEVARSIIDPAKLHIVVVGDAKQIKDSLAAIAPLAE